MNFSAILQPCDNIARYIRSVLLYFVQLFQNYPSAKAKCQRCGEYPYLKYLNYRYNYNDPCYTPTTHNDIVHRRFNLGVNYRFGKLKEVSIRKSKKTFQNEDIKVIQRTIPGT